MKKNSATEPIGFIVESTYKTLSKSVSSYTGKVLNWVHLARVAKGIKILVLSK